MQYKMLWSFVLVFCVVDLVWGIPSGFPGDRCFTARTVSGCTASGVGCNGTLLNVFTTKNTYYVIKDGPNVPDTQFLLFTRSNKIKPEFLHDCSGSLPKNTKFDSKAQTVVIIHDILDGTCRTPWMRLMKDQLLIRDKYNVILVDWTWVDFQYPMQGSLKLVSEQVAYVVKNIMKVKKIDGDMFHFIGHGIGSSIASYGAEMIKEPKQIRRITALDPSCMSTFTSVRREYAQLVDAIHTNEGKCLLGISFGYSDPVGHADFYVNRGEILPSTIIDQYASVKNGENYYAFLCQDRAICNHFQAINYFMASINSCDCVFMSKKCKTESSETFPCGDKGEECPVMGMDWELYPPSNKTVKDPKTNKYPEYCVYLLATYPYCNELVSRVYKKKYKLTKVKKFCTE